jgi:hypothetical protein
VPDLDDHPYLLIYLIGCGLSLIAAFASIVLQWALSWVTKANVVAKNLRKLEPASAKTPIPVRVRKFVVTCIWQAALSWIAVVWEAWRIVLLLLRTAREALTSEPESVRRLRYPLKTNPDLPVESVWAYLCALGIRVGSPPPDEKQLAEELNRASGALPRFDRSTALRQLDALEVVKPAVTSAVLSRPDPEVETDDEDADLPRV